MRGTEGTRPNDRSARTPQTLGSDVIVDLLHAYELPYAALNPGASYRGLHDSIVNYGGNRPVDDAVPARGDRGADRARLRQGSGKPMVAILHNLVGLLHANMAIYYAYIDRAPVFIVGATGPMDETKRRPRIDWIHTALVQGEAVRAYTKWDYQPTVIDGVPESFARAYGVMMTEPRGPIYMMLRRVAAGAAARAGGAASAARSREGADAGSAPIPRRSRRRRTCCSTAKRPVIIAEFVGPRPRGFHALVELAETLGAPVYDVNSAPQLPQPPSAQPEHGEGRLRDADLVAVPGYARLGERHHASSSSATREVTSIVPAGREVDRHRLRRPRDLELGDGLPAPRARRPSHPRRHDARDPGLDRASQARSGQGTRRRNGQGGAAALRSTKARSKWEAEAKEDWDASPITLPRLATEVWNAIKDEDWVLTANTLEEWTRKLWDFDRPYRHPGKSLGTATQIGISLGVALAHRGDGRLVVDLQPDGDLMFDAGRAVGRGQAPHPDPRRHVQQPRLLQRLGAPDPHGEAARHAGRARLHRHGHGRPGARLRRAREVDGLVRARGRSTAGRRWRAALKRAIARVKAGQPALLDTITQKR